MTYVAREHYQGKKAADYEPDRLSKPAHRRAWRRELAIVEGFLREFEPGLRVADIPAGTGRLLPVIEAAGHRAIAADISLDMLLQAAERRARASALVCEAEALPLATGSLDVVVCLRLFQHLPDPAGRAILAEFGRVARRGLILGAPLRQPVTPLIDLARRLVRGEVLGRGPERMLPMRPADFRAVLVEVGGFRWVRQGHVTWWGGQTKILKCDTSATQ